MATALEKGGVTTPLEQRPSVDWHEKIGPIGAPGTATPAAAAPGAAPAAAPAGSASLSVGGGK